MSDVPGNLIFNPAYYPIDVDDVFCKTQQQNDEGNHGDNNKETGLCGVHIYLIVYDFSNGVEHFLPKFCKGDHL